MTSGKRTRRHGQPSHRNPVHLDRCYLLREQEGKARGGCLMIPKLRYQVSNCSVTYVPVPIKYRYLTCRYTCSVGVDPYPGGTIHTVRAVGEALRYLKPGFTVPGYHSITMLATSSTLYLQYTDLLVAEGFQKWNKRRICYGTLAS